MASEEAKKHPEPGTSQQSQRQVSVQTGEGLLTVWNYRFREKRMDAGAFLRGYQIKAGEILG